MNSSKKRAHSPERRNMRRISRRTLAEEYDLSTRTIDRCIRAIDGLIGTRYPPNSIIWSPRVRIRGDVARDYMEHRAEIRQGIAPAFVGR